MFKNTFALYDKLRIPRKHFTSSHLTAIYRTHDAWKIRTSKPGISHKVFAKIHENCFKTVQKQLPTLFSCSLPSVYRTDKDWTPLTSTTIRLSRQKISLENFIQNLSKYLLKRKQHSPIVFSKCLFKEEMKLSEKKRLQCEIRGVFFTRDSGEDEKLKREIWQKRQYVPLPTAKKASQPNIFALCRYRKRISFTFLSSRRPRRYKLSSPNIAHWMNV